MQGSKKFLKISTIFAREAASQMKTWNLFVLKVQHYSAGRIKALLWFKRECLLHFLFNF